ncbi:hypothetical protein BHE74_00004851 [Ensete ventricosum]|nr:hypothetical protein BHE74_00004851 [Ensete ventricosum]
MVGGGNDNRGIQKKMRAMTIVANSNSDRATVLKRLRATAVAVMRAIKATVDKRRRGSGEGLTSSGCARLRVGLRQREAATTLMCSGGKEDSNVRCSGGGRD